MEKHGRWDEMKCYKLVFVVITIIVIAKNNNLTAFVCLYTVGNNMAASDQ